MHSKPDIVESYINVAEMLFVVKFDAVELARTVAGGKPPHTALRELQSPKMGAACLPAPGHPSGLGCSWVVGQNLVKDYSW